VADTPELDQRYEVKCPHCQRTFAAEPMAGAAARYSGFKCPHCRLFVPFERAAEADRLEPVPTDDQSGPG
jgi:hypothetical protein